MRPLQLRTGLVHFLKLSQGNDITGRRGYLCFSKGSIRNKKFSGPRCWLRPLKVLPTSLPRIQTTLYQEKTACYLKYISCKKLFSLISITTLPDLTVPKYLGTYVCMRIRNPAHQWIHGGADFSNFCHFVLVRNRIPDPRHSSSLYVACQCD